MRSVWKGSLKVGLAIVPVKMYVAARDRRPKLHLIHREDGGKIKYKRVCEKCGKEVEWQELGRAVKVGKDKYVPVPDEALEGAEGSGVVEIVAFFPVEQLEPRMIVETHWLVPADGGAVASAFKVLKEAMMQRGVAGLGKVVLRGRQRWVALLPVGEAVAAIKLRAAGELVDWQGLAPYAEAVDRDALEMALQLVDLMKRDLKVEELKDEQTDRLLEAVAGAQEEKSAKGEAEKVVSFMEALVKSVERAA